MRIEKKFLLIHNFKSYTVIRIPGSFGKRGTRAWFMIWISPSRFRISIRRFSVEFNWR